MPLLGATSPLGPTMTDEGLPSAVKKIIGEHIVSVEQLEILLLLHRRPETEWDAASLATELRTSERSAAARLADLATRGFAGVRDDRGTALYRYDPPNGLQRDVELLAKAYAERRYTIIDLIFSKPIENLKVYADAFRFRKDPTDG
jgi:hypothetical protein